jgi:hypothetical protein
VLDSGGFVVPRSLGSVIRHSILYLLGVRNYCDVAHPRLSVVVGLIVKPGLMFAPTSDFFEELQPLTVSAVGVLPNTVFFPCQKEPVSTFEKACHFDELKTKKAANNDGHLNGSVPFRST